MWGDQDGGSDNTFDEDYQRSQKQYMLRYASHSIITRMRQLHRLLLYVCNCTAISYLVDIYTKHICQFKHQKYQKHQKHQDHYTGILVKLTGLAMRIYISNLYNISMVIISKKK